MAGSFKGDVYISISGNTNRNNFIVYDLSGPVVRVHDEFTEFGLHLTRDILLARSTVVNRIYSVARFRKFLRSRSFATEKELEYENLSDETLKEFRSVLEIDAPKRAKRKRKRAFVGTINACLSAVYDWVLWLQDTGRVPDQTIGVFPAAIQAFRNPKKPTQWFKPLLLPRAGRGARSKPMNFVPNDEIKEAALDHLSTSSNSEYVCVRNSLIQRLAERVGLRRDSIASLVAESFKRARLEAAKHSIDVTPPRQKNGYEDSFDVPIDLAYEVCSFIENLRDPFAESKGSKAEELFLSFRNGLPLTPSSMTAIFSKVMKAAGGPLGAALHIWRHRFTQDELDREMAFRRREGLFTSDADVCAAVSRRLGHANPASIKPYLDSYYTRTKRA
ncbi:site-specific integrase [Variovorax sp. PAMC 28711]|uniref:site-specific integrase n=1 Tax=Variovorax sp. PAMC 28711 TaxID=1795631 RepID=UPI000AA0CDE7|nr:site-specific integrase [Variovorax sp. PAMC 28711]